MDITSPITEQPFLPQSADQPADGDDGFHTLDPRQVRVDQIGSLIFTGMVGLGELVGLVIFTVTAGFGSVWLIVAGAAAAIIVLLFFASIFWPPLEYRYARWRLDDVGLQIRRGVLWRHAISIPVARVQHADVSQGPLQRYFQLGTLTIHTAGTQNASVALGGLAHSTATELRDQLVRQRKAIDVV